MLAFRLAAPTLLVDLRKLPDLRKIDVSKSGVVLGSMVRWCDILDDARLRTAHPLLVAAVTHVAHYQIRNRGTIGEASHNADPAAEIPGIVLTCEADIATVGTAGARVIGAADFFVGPLMTVLEPDEIIVEIRLPAWPARAALGFQEFARRRGDFAMAAAAVWYDEDTQGKRQRSCGRLGSAMFRNAARRGGRPQRRHMMMPRSARAEAAAGAAVAPQSDIHASADYRRARWAPWVERALKGARRKLGREMRTQFKSTARVSMWTWSRG